MSCDDLSIEIKNLSFSFYQEEIIKNISLDIEKGGFYSIVGPNGSGKTTILKNLARILEAKEGTILMEGDNINSLSAKKLSMRASFVPQSTDIDFQFSALDIVLMGRTPHLKRFQTERKADIKIAKKSMEMTNTWNLREKPINQLSGGERQRIIVARAIAQDTSILLLDEPISHLDIQHQLELLDMLKELNQTKNITIVVVLHDLNFAANYSSKVVLLNHGSIVAFGSEDKVLTKELIKEVYNVDIATVVNPHNGKRHIIPIAKI